MILINSNLKKGIIKIKIEDPEDLWYLSNIIDIGDIIEGKTLRKIKIGESTDRNQKAIKRPMFISLMSEKIELGGHILRVSGKVIKAPEDVPHGSYHTFNIEEHTIISIIKIKWLNFQLTRIKEACQESKKKILILIHDREEAYFALLKKYGYELLANLKGNVQKKADLDKTKSNFYKDVIEKLAGYDKRFGLNQIIIASPAFWKEELMKEAVDEEMKKKIIFATCSGVDESGINEVLKRPEVKEALKQDRFSYEINLVEELLAEIAKDNLGIYGLKEVNNAAESGAVSKLLISDSIISKFRNAGRFVEFDYMMRAVENAKGVVVIISSEHSGGKKIDGLGGICAILRYKINY